MKKQIAFFDIDGTIFRNSLTIELHWQLIKDGVFPKTEVEAIDSYYWAWVNRKGTYQDYLDRVVESFVRGIKGKKVETIRAAAQVVVARQNNVVYRFTRDLLERLRPTTTLVAISGSPTEIVEEFNKHWRFDLTLGTEMKVADGVYTGGHEIVYAHDKKAAVAHALKKIGGEFTHSFAVGDTESDIGMLESVDEPICFNPTQELYAVAKERKWPVVVERKNVIYHL